MLDLLIQLESIQESFEPSNRLQIHFIFGIKNLEMEQYVEKNWDRVENTISEKMFLFSLFNLYTYGEIGLQQQDRIIWFLSSPYLPLEEIRNFFRLFADFWDHSDSISLRVKLLNKLRDPISSQVLVDNLFDLAFPCYWTRNLKQPNNCKISLANILLEIKRKAIEDAHIDALLDASFKSKYLSDIGLVFRDTRNTPNAEYNRFYSIEYDNVFSIHLEKLSHFYVSLLDA